MPGTATWDKHSARISLFHDRSNTIPDLTSHRRKEMIRDEKECRGERASYISESAWLHAMYHIGAVLINKNQANGEHLDLDIVNNVEDLLTFSGRKNQSPESPPSITKDDLIKLYFQARPVIAINGHHVSKNPLHAVFVIKVALDHIAPEKIYECYNYITEYTRGFSCSSTVITMSKHSQLVSCNAARDILRAYIVSNAPLFPMINQSEMKMLGVIFEANYASNSITGAHSRSGTDCTSALMQMLPRFDYSKQLEIDKRLDWRF